jgi:hypothetical protein
MANEGSARSCEMCLSWLVLRWTRTCHGCRAWKRTYPERGVCPRCRHEAHLNTDGLCKPCLQAIRAVDDAEWALGGAGARPRDLQLIVGAWHDYATQARKLVRRTDGGRRVSQAWRLKLKQEQAPTIGAAAVLEPGLRHQLALFTVPRTLTDATMRAIIGRPLSGWDRARSVLVEMAAEHGLSQGWHYVVAEMVRLALAVREAEGADRLPEPMLRDLPTHRDTVRLVLLRAGLLEAAPEPMRFPRTNQPARTPYLCRFRSARLGSAGTATAGCPWAAWPGSAALRAGTGASDIRAAGVCGAVAGRPLPHLSSVPPPGRSQALDVTGHPTGDHSSRWRGWAGPARAGRCPTSRRHRRDTRRMDGPRPGSAVRHAARLVTGAHPDPAPAAG